MARVEGFEPDRSGQEPIDDNGNPFPVGVWGDSDTGVGVFGTSGARPPGVGVLGQSLGSHPGVLGEGPNKGGISVEGRGLSVGVHGIGTGSTSIGVGGYVGGNRAIAGQFSARGNNAIAGQFSVREDNATAGQFIGRVTVTGFLFKFGGGFEIDHPLDPGNKYLRHSFVESSDMLNVYSGNVTTDTEGEASVMLPDYCEALNQDLRYQLTVIGQFAQAIVTQEVRNNQFTIKTDQPQTKVSWQVTGVRRDPWAVANRIAVDKEKNAEERGRYLHPEVWGQPADLRIHAMLQPSEPPPPEEPPAVERLEELPRMTDPARLEEEW